MSAQGAFCSTSEDYRPLEAIEAEAVVKYESNMKELQKERKMRQKAEKAQKSDACLLS